jgi:hypothetical protein
VVAILRKASCAAGTKPTEEDTISDSNVVAEGVLEAEENLEVIGKFGGPCRGRTYGPLIKRNRNTFYRGFQCWKIQQNSWQFLLKVAPKVSPHGSQTVPELPPSLTRPLA